MRVATAGLLLLGAAAMVGCGDEQVGSPAREATVPEAVESAASPLARGLSPWRTQRPQHLSLAITHVIQPGRLWTGDVETWRRSTARVAGPLLAEAWVGQEDQAVIAPGREQQLAFHNSGGLPLLQVGWPPGQTPPSFPVVAWGEDDDSLGWSATREPDAQMLSHDLARLLDLAALAGWLESVPNWSTALADGGEQLRGKANAPEGDPTWGGVRSLEVTLVLEHSGRVLGLTLEIRREPVSDPTSRGRALWLPSLGRGEASRWAQPFPLAQLQPPEELVETSLPKGYVLTDAPHETTTYVLRPDPGPVSPELERFLRARRVVR